MILKPVRANIVPCGCGKPVRMVCDWRVGRSKCGVGLCGICGGFKVGVGDLCRQHLLDQLPDIRKVIGQRRQKTGRNGK
jgi:hypothetical protein